jgi:hypothetical protein
MDESPRTKVVLQKYSVNITKLCEETGWNREAFSRVANGHRALSVEKAKVIGKLHGFSWTEFFTDPDDRYIQIKEGINGTIIEQLEKTQFYELPAEWLRSTEVLKFYLGNYANKLEHEVCVFSSEKLTIDQTIKKHGPRSRLEYLITCKRGRFFGSVILDAKQTESKYTTIINPWMLEQSVVLTSSIKYMQRIVAYMPQVAKQFK